MGIQQCILDHYSFEEIDPLYDQTNGLISLFGLFPNFTKDKNNLISNKSKYLTYFGQSNPFNLQGIVYQTDINMKTEGFQFVDARHHTIITQYKNGILDGSAELIRKPGELAMKGQYKNGFRDGIWKCFIGPGEVRETKYRDGKLLSITGFKYNIIY